MKQKFMNNEFLCLCYHYIRPEKNKDPFPRILGTNLNEFKNHLSKLIDFYKIISVDDVFNFLCKNKSWKESKMGLLFTFDDGLSDHYIAAQILNKLDIQGLFFIPTCILHDNLPPNPTILHYSIAYFGIKKFLEFYNDALNEYHLDQTKFSIYYETNRNNPWETIDKIKTIFKYKLDYINSRNILLYIYKNLFLKKFPNAMELMHLTQNQIIKMLEMGHSIGTHTHSHISVAASTLSKKDFEKEIIAPKIYLEKNFQTKVIAFSYPFGERQDCLSTKVLISKTNEYSLAFTVDEKKNTQSTSCFEIGRYQLMSTDNSSFLLEKLKIISEMNS